MFEKLIYLVCSVLLLGLAFAGTVNAGRPGLVGHWRLDEGTGTTAGDASGYGNTGALEGGAQWTGGKLDGGVYLDGQDDYIEIPNIISEVGTMSFWFKPDWDGSDPADYRLFDASLGGIYFFISKGADHADINPEDFGFYFEDATDADYQGIEIDPAGVILADTWFHVAVTWEFNGGPAILYINGEEVSRADTLGPLPALHANPRFGLQTIDYIASANGATGVIDDIMIYEIALAPAEIPVIMQGLGQFPWSWNPGPLDGAFLQDTWGTLSWSPGDFAVSHDVYLSDNFDDVDAGTGDSFRGNQVETLLIVGFPGFPYPDGLVPGTTYYWRIDEVNEAEPNSPWKGDIWSFSVPPKTAYNPDPGDDAESVALDAELSWTGGFRAKLHTVYFGDNFDDVNSAAGGLIQGDATFTPPGPLELAKTYYWRVDEFDPPMTYKGAVWSFTSEGTATDPVPAKGAVDVSPTPILKWTPANLAASHEVYFGADADAVKNAGKTSSEHKETKALGAESYDAGRLELETTYYWRVDEVNDTNPGSPWVGNVWSFTTGDFLVVDDFESYNDIDPPDEASNRIFDKWIDGFGTTTNGALVGNDLPPYAEQTIVHGGAQSIIYRYDNANKTSEATMTLVYPRDWTEEGVTRLSLWFRGVPTNAAERMFVALNGVAAIYHDDPAATQLTGWNEWIIDLAAFGVDLTNVNSITIGIGTKNSPAADGGTGTMYFDDIRLIR
ncbi:MAG: hypothetical protein CEE38_06205 [Planctomycetes bacterium B3_Pla]|nr:MAG: hypothetical protein CEE38_06205 [Planctomycetes bacterium B3_Pla]